MPATPYLNTISLPDFTDLVERNFSIVSQLVQINAAQLFISDDQSVNTGDTRLYEEADTETYALLKREGENAKRSQVGTGYTKICRAKRFAREIQISFEMRRYNKEPEVMSKLTSLANFTPQRHNLDLTHRFTFSNATSYVDMDGETVDISTGDGLSLINAAHTLAFVVTTYRNRVVGDPIFSQAALESALSLTTTDILSNFGERRVLSFNTIITGDDPTTIRTVRQLLESTADVDAVQAGIVNTYKARMNHVILPQLATTASGAADSTKKRWWFIGATGQGLMGWQAYDATWEPTNLKAPAAGNNLEDGHSDDWYYGVRSAWGICALAGRGLIGSLPVS